MTNQILSQEEVDALLQGIADDVEAPEEAATVDGVRDHDLASSGRLVRGRMPTLEIINERFARNVRVGLFDMIRKGVEVGVNAVRIQKYGEFLREIVVPTSFNVMSVQPLNGSGLVVCEPSLVFAVIDALFGGSGKYQTRIEGREFSATEQRVIVRLVEVVAAELKKAWHGIYPLELVYQRSEMLPQFASIAGPNEVVVASSFSIDIGESSGIVHICIPYSVLEPIRNVLYSTVQGTTVEPADRRWVELLKQQIEPAEIELVAELATAPATIEQLLSFKVGDFVELDLRPVIEVKASGVPVFSCHYGTSAGKYALKVDRMVTDQSPGWLRERSA
ncbi:MAG: flagellar motor switch protein FliM [Pseudomonadota bacterium]|nr:flagellar motor switch protein FliM [Pseudomonadota bacterium]